MSISLSSVSNALPQPHTIALSGLGLALFVNFLYRPSASFAVYLLAMAAIAIAGHVIWKKGFKYDIFFKDTLVSLLIILLLVEPATTMREAIPGILVVVASVVLRTFVRYKGLPIFNPAASAIMAVTLLSYTGLFTLPLVSWWGANYTLSFDDFRISFGTILSCVLAALIVIKLRKWWFALVFFGVYAALNLAFGNSDLISAILTDGTIYFFFAVMACEPKTAPVATKHQLIVGAVLALALVLGMQFDFPAEYVMALLVANVASASLKHVPFLKRQLG